MFRKGINFVGTGAVSLSFLLTGCARSVAFDEQLFSEFFSDVQSCVSDQGFEPPESDGMFSPEDFASGKPEAVAYDVCWGDLASADKYEALEFIAPSQEIDAIRSEAFAAWKCIEDSGYVRIATIPLSAEKGWPLLPSPAGFDVADNTDSIETFYKTAANCYGMDIDNFRNPFGDLDYSSGETTCIVTDHDDVGLHSHGCFSTDTYPTE